MRSLFAPCGVHILADGQFGSSGKGNIAAYLAARAWDQEVEFAGVITNAGPNSGHTSYYLDRKIVLKQLPTFAVHSFLHGNTIPVYFSAGAIIDPEILIAEHKEYPDIPIFIHPCAAVVSSKDKESERDPASTYAAIASTQSGTGAALARKIRRDPYAIYCNHSTRLFPYYQTVHHPTHYRYFMEISQGFSLGINDPRFYPNVTSRECTFTQGMADARIAMRHYQRGYLCFRSYPIRVGNLGEFSSGDWYPDQWETSWKAIGVPPELTTVTKRIRRIATFSWKQFEDAIHANDPHFICLTFLDYLDAQKRADFLKKHMEQRNVTGEYDFIFSNGPGIEDISVQNS